MKHAKSAVPTDPAAHGVAGASANGKGVVEHGITQAPMDCFHYRDFRDTDPDDALCPAQRTRPSH